MTAIVRHLSHDDALLPGDLVHYRWWCAKTHDWITDCTPHLLLERLDDGTLLVLVDGVMQRIPKMLLKRADVSCKFFAAVI
jgi:hypothetical protein